VSTESVKAFLVLKADRAVPMHMAAEIPGFVKDSVVGHEYPRRSRS